MHNVDDAIRKQVVNMVVSIPGHIRGMEVAADGKVLVGLQSDGDLLITIKDPAKEHSDSSLLKGPVHRFALRPSVNELAVARHNSASIERYALHGVSNPKRLAFADLSYPTAVGYNGDGSLLAAGSQYGKIVVWNLEEDGPARAIVESQVANERIVKVDFGFHCLVVLTASGKCFRVPFHFAVIPKVLVRAKAEPRLIGGDGKPYDWHCYAYAHHPTLSLEAFGGECAVLVSQHEMFGMCGVKLTGLGRYIHKLTFCPRTRRLVAMGELGVQIWSIHNSVLFEKWQVAGDLAKLGRAAATVKFLEESYTAPEAGLKPLAYAVVDDTSVVYWG